MSLNFIAESQNKVKWEDINNELCKGGIAVEFFPIPSESNQNGDSIGISIPRNNVCEGALQEIKNAICKLVSKFSMEVYDMYSGEKVDINKLEYLKNYFT